MSSADETITPSDKSHRGGKAAQVIPFLLHPRQLLPSMRPIYKTELGAAFLADSLEGMTLIPDNSVNLVVTSPPYALHFQKEYGNVAKSKYVEWFVPFAFQILRILREDGSFILNIGGSYNAGSPTRSLYVYRLLLELCENVGFHLAQEFFWHNPAKLPAPAEWVNVRRLRVKDSIEYIFWLSKTEWPKADNRKVLVEYSNDMKRLIARGYKAKQRPSGHNITSKFRKDKGGSIPSNVITRGNNESNSVYFQRLKKAGLRPHPARFPQALPEFFLKFLTDENDIVVDPFAGSNTSGAAAERHGRRWLSFEIDPHYVEASRYRFDGLAK
ncbi:MAG: site-specific DNA-methyltransferase [Spirochaetia bacterium]|jgi:site-specific DNA-methyltransferase (cytosine-N4-specific)